MTYGELKVFVLKLLNRYSVAGERVPLSYNDQTDIVARIPELVRDALQYLATSGRRLREVKALESPKRMGEFYLYDLPDDCYQLCGGLIRLTKGGDVVRYRNYRLVAGRQILIPMADAGQYLAEYFRYPVLIGNVPDDGEVLDCPPEAQSAIAYYVAAHLAMGDDNYLHAALHNEFELKMMRLQESPMAECGVAEDVYG